MHVVKGLPNPLEGRPRLDLILKGIKRGKPKQRDGRLLVTPLILRALAERIDVDSKMMWAAMCSGLVVVGFMRTGEFTVSEPHSAARVLAIADMSVDSRENPQLVNLRLRSSKTNQYGEGVTISLARNDSDWCPMAAVLAYVAVRPPGAGPLLT